MPGWAGETDLLAGAGVVEDFSLLRASLANGDWVAADLHGINLGLGAVGAVVDPVGAVAATGASWLMEHIDPLRTWLDDLAGDPPAVMADAARLDDASRQVTTLADDLDAVSTSRLASMQGETIEACGRYARHTARDAEQFAGLLGAGARAMRLASGIVDAVRSLVRDAIAELVGMVTSAATTVLLTAGTGTPVIMTRVAFRARTLTMKLSTTMKSLAHSFEALRVLLSGAERALETLARSSRARRPTRGTPTPTSPVTWSSEVRKRLATIKPPVFVVQTGIGATTSMLAASDP